MNTSKLSCEIDCEDIDSHRRRLFGVTAITIAAAQLGMIGVASAQSTKTQPARVRRAHRCSTLTIFVAE
jgi:hypothetical protein